MWNFHQEWVGMGEFKFMMYEISAPGAWPGASFAGMTIFYLLFLSGGILKY